MSREGEEGELEEEEGELAAEGELEEGEEELEGEGPPSGMLPGPSSGMPPGPPSGMPPGPPSGMPPGPPSGMPPGPQPGVSRSISSIVERIPPDLERGYPPPFVSTASSSLLLTATATSTIWRINNALESNNSDIRLNPLPVEIDDKLKKNPSYFLRTSHNIEENLYAKIMEIKHLVHKEGRTLIVDLTNLYYDIKRSKSGYSKEQYVHYLYYLICKVAEENGIINIIICQQNHFKKQDSYRAQRDFFRKCIKFSTYNVTFLTGHNRSSEDDLYVMLCIEECIKVGKMDFFILSQDRYRDFFYRRIYIYDSLNPNTKINFDSYRDRYTFDHYITRVETLCLAAHLCYSDTGCI
jgi:hypothetical protein